MSHSTKESTPAWCRRGDESSQSDDSKPLPTIRVTPSSGHSSFLQRPRPHCCGYKIKHCITCIRHFKLRKLFRSQTALLETLLLNFPLLASRSNIFQDVPVTSQQLRQPLDVYQQQNMAYADTYTAFWNYQIRLFNDMEVLKTQMTTTERQLNRALETLTSNGLRRNDRRRANWAVTSNRRHLVDLDLEMKALMQALDLCQYQIANMHTQASQTMSTPYNYFAGYSAPQIWDLSHIPAPVARPLSTDSGFHEPALYAQPFDLNPSQDYSTHLFAHEISGPLAVQEEVFTTPVALNPTAADFTPAAAKEPLYSDSRNTIDEVPVSPLTETPGSRTKKRYSEAAISLIENRLRKQKRFQEGRVIARSDEVEDVNVEVAVEDAKRQRDGSEVRGLVWPYSA